MGGFDPKTPIDYSNSNSAYHKLLREVDAKKGVFNDKSWDNSPVGAPYVPPWRATMIETYGAKTVAKMKAPVDTYEER